MECALTHRESVQSVWAAVDAASRDRRFNIPKLEMRWAVTWLYAFISEPLWNMLWITTPLSSNNRQKACIHDTTCLASCCTVLCGAVSTTTACFSSSLGWLKSHMHTASNSDLKSLLVMLSFHDWKSKSQMTEFEIHLLAVKQSLCIVKETFKTFTICSLFLFI